MQKLLVAIDLSERSDRALRRAVMLARKYDAELTLLHVVEADQSPWIANNQQTEAKTMLDRLAVTLKAMDGLSCNVRVPIAPAFTGIVETAAEIGADLLVIGPNRQQGLRDLFADTTAERSIRLAPCPVLMANAMATGNYRHVMRTSDLSPVSAEALQRYAALGLEHQARNSLMHIFDAPAARTGQNEAEQAFYLGNERSRAEVMLKSFAREAGIEASDTVLQPLKNNIAHDMLAAASGEYADLLIISTRGRGGLAKLVIGSVAERVLARATIDVLAIPPRQT